MKRAVPRSKPGNLTLKVMRPVFLAIERGDRAKVRELCQLILKALRKRKRELLRDRAMIEKLVERYGR